MISDKMMEEICLSKLPLIKRDSCDRRIWIYGAGVGGKILKKTLSDGGIAVFGFIDRNADNIRQIDGIEVTWMDNLNPQRDYIVISLKKYDNEVVEICKKYHFYEEDIFYLIAGEGFNKEDIYYKNCLIGRYTYGYEGLLEYYPLAQSIGRYCSINGTAKIWNNHSLDCVTTHPFLDYPLFYAWDKQKERNTLICKYGKNFENSEFENSFLRNNKPIIIGNDVWIGANVVVLPGVSIGNGAIIGAGAVVAQDVEPYAIVGGVPAKIIRYRYSSEQIEKFQKIQWWNWEHDRIEENIELFYQIDKFLDVFGK